MKLKWIRWRRKTIKRDKLLMAWGLLLSLISVQFFVDGTFKRHDSRKNERIALLQKQKGDIRLRLSGTSYWTNAKKDDGLGEHDSIFAGENSQAEVKLEHVKLKVNPNTMLYLRRHSGLPVIDLMLGNAEIEVKAGEKVFVTSPGQGLLELTSESGGKISLSRDRKGHLTAQSKSGAIHLRGGEVQKTIAGQDVIQFEKAIVRELGYRILSPGQDQVWYFEKKGNIEFQYRQSLESMTAKGKPERIELEFSKTNNFAQIDLTFPASPEGKTKIEWSDSARLYYRIKDSNQEISETRLLRTVRMQAPQPKVELKNANSLESAEQSNRQVRIELNRPEEASDLWLQVSSDPEFLNKNVNLRTAADEWNFDLPPGQYFMRAQSFYDGKYVSSWSPVQSFTIEKNSVELSLPLANVREQFWLDSSSFAPHVLDSNRRVQMQHILDSPQFAPLKQVLHEAQSMGESLKSEPTLGADVTTPGRHAYRLLYEDASNKSLVRELKYTVHLLPPRLKLQTAPSANLVPLAWSPTLLTTGYEVETWTSASPLQKKIHKMQDRVIIVERNATQVVFARVRSLNREGEPISNWSETLAVQPLRPVQNLTLAKREPAQDGTSTMEAPAASLTSEPPRFWSWVGTGANYVNYQQEVEQKANISFQEFTSPSFFAEIGYISTEGWGAVANFKHTPGTVQTPNAEVDSRDYQWQTVSLDAIKRAQKTYRFLSGRVSVAGTAGLQYHLMPYLNFLPGNRFAMVKNQITTGAFGFATQYYSNRTRYEWNMRYQIPLASSSTGGGNYSAKPQFAFDGLLGASYSMSQNFRIGTFWYGQWHQFTSEYSDSRGTNLGTQSLFYSNLDFRIGYEF